MSDPRFPADELKANLQEKHRLFRRLVAMMLIGIAITFVFVIWIVGQPSSHDEQQLAAPPAASWPDGSPHQPSDGSG